MKLARELNPIKFLDTKRTNIHGAYKFSVFHSSDFYHSKRILSNFDEKIPLIKEKFIKAEGFSCKFQKGK